MKLNVKIFNPQYRRAVWLATPTASQNPNMIRASRWLTWSIVLAAVFAGSVFSAVGQTIPRGRPQLNAARTTFVADNGQRLRGPYTSTEWTSAAPADQIANIRNLGFNAVHLYAEVFSPNWPTSGNAPGYNVAEVDKIVAATRTNGLYLIMTIGNGANNGNHNLQWATNFWNFYAARYANETHVLYEIHNEPLAWGPSYLTGTTPPGTMNLEIAAYRAIRANAPHTPVLLFSYAVLSGNGGANAALTDIHAFNQAIFGTQNAVWTNEAVAFHGYGGWEGTATAVNNLINAGYPCFMTEFGWPRWGRNRGVALELELTTDLERLGVSWLTFQYIPPSGVSDPVTLPDLFKDLVDNSGLGWTPDFGTWPVLRGVFGNNGQPRSTVANWVNNFLTGTVRIQAEDFDWGGDGVSSHDTTPTNAGGLYRLDEAVDIAACNDVGGGFKVSEIEDGEWLEYSILVRQPGYYDLALRYATPNSGGTVEARSAIAGVTARRTLASTGSHTTWATATVPVYLSYGRQILRLQIPTGGFDLNWVELSPTATGLMANGTYKFLNAATALAMQGVTGTNRVVVTNDSGAALQRWNVQHLGGGQYRVVSAANSSSWNAANDVLALVSSWNTSKERCYLILPGSGGFHRLLPVSSGLSLNGPAATGAIVEQQEASGSANQQWAILAPATPAFPAGLSATALSATQIALAWNSVAGATSYSVKRSAASGGPYTTIATGLTTSSFTNTVNAGIKYYYVVTAFSGIAESPNSVEASVNPPYPWLSQDLGTVSVTGGVNFSNGVFTVGGSGGDIWGTADAFRFIYLPVSGNCTITARVTGVQNTDAWAKAGVMIRASLAANSANAFVAVTPGNGVSWQYRTSAGGNSGNNATGGLTAPYWVRLVRSGNTFTAYRSPNGVTWTQQGSPQNITMGTTVYVGLAVTAHSPSSLCTATFDNVSLPGWQNVLPPLAPASLAATAANGQANLVWPAAANATSYNVRRATTDGGPYTFLANVSTTNHTDSGLTNGTAYYYVVSALNQAGESANSTQVTVTPEALVVSGLAAVAVSASQIDLTWNALDDATGYNVKRSLINGGPYTTVGGAVITTNYQDSGLAGGTIYYYVVSAVLPGSETPDSASVAATTFTGNIGTLIHRYQFGESGGSILTDSVGGPIWNGTLPSGGLLAGGTLTLASSSHQYGTFPAGITTSLSNITVMAWVNLASLSDWSRVFEFGNDFNTNFYLTARSGLTGTLQFGITTNGSGAEQQISGGGLTAGVWHQVAVTLASGVGVLYLDGVAVGTNASLTLSPASLGTTAVNYIGKSQYAVPSLNGALDEFRIYHAALSSAEIAATAALGPNAMLSTNAPQLQLSASGADLTLSWPVANADVIVQSRTNLFLGGWETLSSPVWQIVGDRWEITLPSPGAGGGAFFRLAK